MIPTRLESHDFHHSIHCHQATDNFVDTLETLMNTRDGSRDVF